MKKSKRLILFVMSMVLVFSMAFGGIMTANAAESSTEIDNTYSVGLLEALKISKISGIGVSEWTGNLTRGEAAFLIAGLIQLDRSKQETVFDDVSTEAYYAGSVASLYDSGIILKSWGSKKYKPDEPITYGDFITMLCKALGYMGYAESKGGYPIGYFEVAKQFKLTKGVSVATDGFIDKKYVPKLIMNALDAYYLGLSGIDQEGYHEAEKRGIVLNDYFDTYKYTGLLEEAGPFSITNNFQASDNQITVGGINFKIKNAPSEYFDLLGQQVTIYYKEGKQTVYVYPDADNNTLVIPAQDIIGQTTADALKYYDEADKECRAKLSSELITVYNGTKLNGATLEPAYGKVVLVDNDGNGKYDVAKVWDYKLATVSAVDSYENTITFEPFDGSENIVLDTEVFESYKMTGTNGKNIKAASLSVEDIVLCAVNQPRNAENIYYDIIVSKNATTGNITAIGTEELGIGDAKYELSPVVNEFSAKLGDVAKVHLDAEGRVLYVEIEGYNYKSAKYALYLGWDQVKGGSKPRWDIELFTQDGALVDLMIAEKIKINGEKYKTSDSYVAIFFDGLANEDLIKYNIADGELTEIYTPTDWGSQFRYWEFGKEFNKYSVPGSPNWRTTDNMFSSWISLASDAIRFYIAHDEDGNFDEEKSIVSTTKPVHDQAISNIVLWDIDKAGRAHAYKCTPQESENLSTGTGSNNYSFFIVTKVIDAADEDGIPGKYIFGLMGGSEKQYFVSSEDYDKCGVTSTYSPFNVGNVIKIRTSGSSIVGVMKNAKNGGSNYICFEKSELDEPVLTKAGEVHQRSYEFAKTVATYYNLFAKIVKIEDGLVYFACANNAGEFGIAQISDVNSAFCVKQGGTVYKYDPEGEELFNVVSWDDVKESTGLTGAEDDEFVGSTVLINVTNFAIADVIILD